MKNRRRNASLLIRGGDEIAISEIDKVSSKTRLERNVFGCKLVGIFICFCGLPWFIFASAYDDVMAVVGYSFFATGLAVLLTGYLCQASGYIALTPYEELVRELKEYAECHNARVEAQRKFRWFKSPILMQIRHTNLQRELAYNKLLWQRLAAKTLALQNRDHFTAEEAKTIKNRLALLKLMNGKTLKARKPRVKTLTIGLKPA